MPSSMPTPSSDLSKEQIDLLLNIAREAIATGLAGDHQWRPDLKPLPERLHRPGACFVTLFTKGELHGCIGSVEPRHPLAHDVAKNAISAAFNDPRFPALKTSELPYTAIEISILSPLREVTFDSMDHLIEQLVPGEDGVLVERGWNRGLLLPQVWEKITEPARISHARRPQSTIQYQHLRRSRCKSVYISRVSLPPARTKRLGSRSNPPIRFLSHHFPHTPATTLTLTGDPHDQSSQLA